jgi:ABC-type Na+ efflux pump permease subunit
MNTTKILHVARREFLATVMTKGFLIGLLLMPAMLAVGFTVVPKMMRQRQKPIEGEVALVDPTGVIATPLAAALQPEAVGSRRAAEIAGNLPPAVRDAGLGDVTSQQALALARQDAPVFHLLTMHDDAAAKAWLTAPASGLQRLAVIAIDSNAVHADGAFGGYRIWVAPRLDPRVENGLYDGVREALISSRTIDSHLDRSRLEAVMRVSRPRSKTLTGTGEQATDPGVAQALPFVFIALMFVGVMVGGQGLMTSTVEEKSSRVVEVLLSAISPLELMAGKILGQLAVSALTLALYIGLGLLLLSSLAMLGIVQPMLIVYLVVFYVIGYMTVGALMAAIGAAVNEMREAQQLMTPITLMIIIPWVLAGPILRNPNSTFATVISFVPPMNTYAMLMRATSIAPPPAWQIVLSIVVGLAGVAAAIWIAAKVFKVGLLMFGKPPDFATLVRWVRMA